MRFAGRAYDYRTGTFCGSATLGSPRRIRHRGSYEEARLAVVLWRCHTRDVTRPCRCSSSGNRGHPCAMQALRRHAVRRLRQRLRGLPARWGRCPWLSFAHRERRRDSNRQPALLVRRCQLGRRVNVQPDQGVEPLALCTIGWGAPFRRQRASPPFVARAGASGSW
jgi:hypothetical protein